MEANPNQWQDIGNCNVCRRNQYCRTQCSANKRLMKEISRKLLRQDRAAKNLEKIKKAEGESDE